MSAIQPDRLKEAREWVGFTLEDVATALRRPARIIAGFENGTIAPTQDELRRLGRLYRRPLDWFSGESRFEPSPELLRQIEGVPAGDREVLLEFAEWLQDAGPPDKPRRDTQ